MSPMLSAFDEQNSRGIRVASEPAHWRGTAPRRVLAPDGTAVGDTDVGLGPDELRDDAPHGCCSPGGSTGSASPCSAKAS